jgi:hypothetical protein
MKTSESTAAIYPAIITLQSQMTTIKRDKTVSTGKYKFNYAPLDSIMETIKPLLIAQGLAVVQAVDADTLSTRLIHTSGEWIESETFLNREHASMQGFGGEVTYKRRYALSALIGLVSDDDNDAPETKKRGLVIGAKSGIGDDLPEDWKIYLTDLADDVSSRVNAGRVIQAIELIDDAQLDGDQRVFLENKLPSNVCSALKLAKRPQQ